MLGEAGTASRSCSVVRPTRNRNGTLKSFPRRISDVLVHRQPEARRHVMVHGSRCVSPCGELWQVPHSLWSTNGTEGLWSALW